jgi:hypothetical protein
VGTGERIHPVPAFNLTELYGKEINRIKQVTGIAVCNRIAGGTVYTYLAD